MISANSDIWPVCAVVDAASTGVFFPQFGNVDNSGTGALTNLTNATLTAGDSSFLPGGAQTRNGMLAWILLASDDAASLTVTDHAGNILYFVAAVDSDSAWGKPELEFPVNPSANPVFPGGMRFSLINGKPAGTAAVTIGMRFV